MKKDIHPENYRLVAFKDMSNDEVFLTKSTADTKETLEVEGTEYPLVKLEISRTSHPFYTGKAKLLDTAGRIDKFKNKYDKFKKKKAAPAENPAKQEAPKAEAPKAEAPKAEVPKKVASNAEEKAEPAKKEAPKAEAKAETVKKEAPKAETVKKEAPKAEAKPETPKKEAPEAAADTKEKE